MKNVVIIGACSSGKTQILEKLIELASFNNLPIVFFAQDNLITKIARQQIELAIQENKNQLEEIKKVAFERESLEFINHRNEFIEPKIYNDVPRNKFFDKPRHNFNKR